jgi:hypothetical protein
MKIAGSYTLYVPRERSWPLIQEPAWLVRAITSDSGAMLDWELQVKSQRLILPVEDGREDANAPDVAETLDLADVLLAMDRADLDEATINGYAGRAAEVSG